MKATFDLPADLVRQLKLRAVRERRKLKDAAADVLRAGLATPAAFAKESGPVIVIDKKTGLPVIQCRRAAPKGEALTPKRVAEILSSQEAEWARDSA
jgi:plasmid stability protein